VLANNSFFPKGRYNPKMAGSSVAPVTNFKEESQSVRTGWDFLVYRQIFDMLF
jgi:hypothetical protein